MNKLELLTHLVTSMGCQYQDLVKYWQQQGLVPGWKNCKPVSEVINKILFDKFGISEKELTPDANLRHDLGIDSLEQLDLIVDLEKVFDCKISDEDADKISTVKDIEECINRCLEQEQKKVD